MRSDTIRRYTSVHTWTGITTGILLFVAFYAGALIVYKAELEQWADPRHQQDLRAMKAGQTFTPQQMVDAFVAGEHARSDFFVAPRRYTETFPASGEPAPGRYEISWVERPENGPRTVWHQTEPGGEPVASTAGSVSQAAAFIERLHYTMGLPEQIGTYVFGLVTLIYGVALISGLIIHLPHLVRDVFALRLGKNLKRLWQDAHNVIGVVSLPFHLMFVVTSFLLTVSIVAILGLNVFTLGNQLSVTSAGELFEYAPEHEDTDAQAEMLDVTTLLARAREELPGFQAYSIFWHGYGTATATAELVGRYDDSIIGIAAMEFDAVTGALRGADKPGQHNPSRALGSLVVTLHYGRFGDGAANEIVRAGYLLLGLLGAFLFYSGNLLWIETRRKRRTTTQPRHHHALARLTVAGCIGSALGVSLLLLVAKLLPADFAARASWVPNAWYIGLALSCVWVLIRPVWRGAVELLWACAVLTLALPVANAVVGMPPWQSWALAPGILAVDMAAVLLGVAFALTARSTARRARAGNPYSVWAASA